MAESLAQERIILKVLSGVQAGGEVYLPAGDYAVGSGANDDVQFVDVSLKSGHARLRIGAGEIAIMAVSGPIETINGISLASGSETWQELEPLDIVTAGTIRFALGPATANWTSLSDVADVSASKLPSRSKRRKSETRLSAASLRPMSAVRVLFPVLLLVFVAGGIWYVLSSSKAATGEVANASRSDVDQLRDAFDKFPFGKAITLKQEVDGTIYAAGYVESPVERRALMGAAEKLGEQVRFRINVLQTLRSEIENLIKSTKLPLTFVMDGSGNLQLDGLILNDETEKKFVDGLKSDVTGIGTVDDRIRTAKSLFVEIQKLARVSQIDPYVVFRLDKELVEVNGILPIDKIDAWVGFLQSYTNKFGKDIGLRSFVQLQNAAGAVVARADPVPGQAIVVGDSKPGSNDIVLDIERLKRGLFDMSDLFIGLDKRKPSIATAAAEPAQPANAKPGVPASVGPGNNAQIPRDGQTAAAAPVERPTLPQPLVSIDDAVQPATRAAIANTGKQAGDGSNMPSSLKSTVAPALPAPPGSLSIEPKENPERALNGVVASNPLAPSQTNAAKIVPAPASVQPPILSLQAGNAVTIAPSPDSKADMSGPLRLGQLELDKSSPPTLLARPTDVAKPQTDRSQLSPQPLVDGHGKRVSAPSGSNPMVSDAAPTTGQPVEYQPADPLSPPSGVTPSASPAQAKSEPVAQIEETGNSQFAPAQTHAATDTIVSGQPLMTPLVAGNGVTIAASPGTSIDTGEQLRADQLEGDRSSPTTLLAGPPNTAKPPQSTQLLVNGPGKRMSTSTNSNSIGSDSSIAQPQTEPPQSTQPLVNGPGKRVSTLTDSNSIASNSAIAQPQTEPPQSTQPLVNGPGKRVSTPTDSNSIASDAAIAQPQTGPSQSTPPTVDGPGKRVSTPTSSNPTMSDAAIAQPQTGPSQSSPPVGDGPDKRVVSTPTSSNPTVSDAAPISGRAAESLSPSSDMNAGIPLTQAKSERVSQVEEIADLVVRANALIRSWLTGTAPTATGDVLDKGWRDTLDKLAVTRASIDQDYKGPKKTDRAMLAVRYLPLFTGDNAQQPSPADACWEKSHLSARSLPVALFWLDLLSISTSLSIEEFSQDQQRFILEAALNPNAAEKCLERSQAGRGRVLNSLYLSEAARNPDFIRFITRNLSSQVVDVSGASLAGQRFIQTRDGYKLREGMAPNGLSRIAMVGELGVAIRTGSGYGTVIYGRDLNWTISEN